MQRHDESNSRPDPGSSSYESGRSDAGSRSPHAVGESTGLGAPGRSLSPDEFIARFEHYADPLWCIAAGILSDRTLADDVLQEAAMIGLQKIEQFEAGTNFLGWVGRIVQNVAMNMARKRKRQQTATSDPAALDRRPRIGAQDDEVLVNPARTIDSRGEVLPDQHSFDDVVLNALNTLSPPARACVLLRIVHGLSYREISLALDVPEGTAMSHVHRSRQSLRSMINPGVPSDEKSQPSSQGDATAHDSPDHGTDIRQ